jgi:Alpha/beta hydrolase domain
MKGVELYARVRFAVQIEGVSRREAARRFGIDPRTVAKMLAFSVPPGYRREPTRTGPRRAASAGRSRRPTNRLTAPVYWKFESTGVHQIEARVPLGTSTGWNIRQPNHRGPNLCSLTGSYFPFAITKAQRLADGDPRPSFQELYGTHAGFVNAVTTAANQLVEERRR